MHSSVPRSSSFFSGEIFPTGKVQALSPTQPFTVAPTSTDRISPSRRIVSLLGMPCTICSFTEAQMLAGNPP